MEIGVGLFGAVILYMFARQEAGLAKLRDSIDRHTASTDGLIALLNRINGRLS
jgi:hypothetical protein